MHADQAFNFSIHGYKARIILNSSVRKSCTLLPAHVALTWGLIREWHFLYNLSLTISMKLDRYLTLWALILSIASSLLMQNQTKGLAHLLASLIAFTVDQTLTLGSFNRSIGSVLEISRSISDAAFARPSAFCSLFLRFGWYETNSTFVAVF